MKLAIVIPILNEQDILPELFRRVSEACARVTDAQWRIVLVNDGSADDSVRLIQEQQARDARFTLVDLSRNFGHQPAISAGLAHAGDVDAVIVMDGDLQDPPEVIPDLVASWRDGGQVVRALRRSRPERGLRGLGYALFYRLFHWLSDYPIPHQTGVFGLLDREAVAQLNQLPERNRFIPQRGSALSSELYMRAPRSGGRPDRVCRLFRYAFDATFSFSYAAADADGARRPDHDDRRRDDDILLDAAAARDRDGADRLHDARHARAISRRRAARGDRRAGRVPGADLRRGEAAPAVHREVQGSAARRAREAMKSEQYALHASIEERHWWFLARRTIMRRLVERIAPAPRQAIVDLGCGTGANIAALADAHACVGVSVGGGDRVRGRRLCRARRSAAFPAATPESFDARCATRTSSC